MRSCIFNIKRLIEAGKESNKRRYKKHRQSSSFAAADIKRPKPEDEGDSVLSLRRLFAGAMRDSSKNLKIDFLI